MNDERFSATNFPDYFDELETPVSLVGACEHVHSIQIRCTQSGQHIVETVTRCTDNEAVYTARYVHHGGLYEHHLQYLRPNGSTPVRYLDISFVSPVKPLLQNSNARSCTNLLIESGCDADDVNTRIIEYTRVPDDMEWYRVWNAESAAWSEWFIAPLADDFE